MSLQSELIKSNINPQPISSYSKIEIKGDSYINNNNDYKVIDNHSEISSEETKTDNKNIIIINGKSYSVNSDQIRPITHKYIYSKLGNTHTFFADERGNPLIIIGPHWPFSVGVILGFSILFFSIRIYFRDFLSNLNLAFGYLSFFFFLITYVITVLMNPGYPKQDEDTLNNKNKNKTGYCLVCKIYINLEKKTKHCKFCNICIEGMDHHCPWTGKCIGKKNLIPFYFFLLSVICFFTYCITTIMKFKDNLKKNLENK